MQILVVGANGLLGSNITTVALDQGETIEAAYHSEEPEFECPCYQVDVTSSQAVSGLVDDVDPDAIVNCAAMTDVDLCESNANRAFAVNAKGAKNIAEAAKKVNAKLIHTSTDYVFDGNQRTPYTEKAEPKPRQVYGESKLKGEQYVRKTHSNSIIVRLSFVYGRLLPEKTLTGFPAWVHKKIHDGEEISLFTDQYISPSYAKSTAMTLLELLTTDYTGTYNVVSQSCVTPYEFGELIAKKAGVENAMLTNSSMNSLERKADRPHYTCLDTSAVENALGRPQPTLSEDLNDLF